MDKQRKLVSSSRTSNVQVEMLVSGPEICKRVDFAGRSRISFIRVNVVSLSPLSSFVLVCTGAIVEREESMRAGPERSVFVLDIT